MELIDVDRSVSSQRALFLHNRVPLDPPVYAELVAFETAWIDRLVASLEAAGPVPTFGDFRNRLQGLIDQEANTPAPNAVFLADQADRRQFKVIIDQFAVDALTEAQAFFAILPRLPMRAQMAIQRILIDEFGCGNLDQMHTQLYCRLLEELGSPTDLQSFLERTLDPVFEFVNIFHWMSKRARDVEYFLGALAWFEGVVPALFLPYVTACERLRISAHHYFTEHIHIDAFHAQSALLAIRETAKSEPVDYAKVWIGALLAQSVTGRAFDASVELARRGEA